MGVYCKSINYPPPREITTLNTFLQVIHTRFFVLMQCTHNSVYTFVFVLYRKYTQSFQERCYKKYTVMKGKKKNHKFCIGPFTLPAETSREYDIFGITLLPKILNARKFYIVTPVLGTLRPSYICRVPYSGTCFF